MAKKPQLPIKDVMAAIDKKDRHWYSKLTEDQKKAFSAWMLMRYTSSCQGSNALHFLYFTNLFVNQNFSDISKHPELQWLLLTATGTSKKEFHPYIKPPNARKKKNKVHEFLSEIYPTYKSDELSMLVELNTKQDLIELAQAHGYDDKQISDIFGK